MSTTRLIELTDDESLVLYHMIREEFDRNINSVSSSDRTLVSLAAKFGFSDLAQQMAKDADFGKTQIPQPPQPKVTVIKDAISRDEWLHKLQLQSHHLPSRP